MEQVVESLRVIQIQIIIILCFLGAILGTVFAKK